MKEERELVRNYKKIIREHFIYHFEIDLRTVPIGFKLKRMIKYLKRLFG